MAALQSRSETQIVMKCQLYEGEWDALEEENWGVHEGGVKSLGT